VVTDHETHYCESTAYGPQGRISFEWNDLLVEDFKQDALSSLKLFSWPEDGRRPDVVVVQLGYMACFLAYNRENGANCDGTIENRAFGNLSGWIKAMSSLMQTKLPSTTLSIVSLASRNRLMDYYSDVCTGKLNRKIASIAHHQKLMVFEREEMEYRLFYRSEQTDTPIVPPRNLSHFPVPQIVSASLVSMLACMDLNVTFHLV
jgi:hypothetical protein